MVVGAHPGRSGWQWRPSAWPRQTSRAAPSISRLRPRRTHVGCMHVTKRERSQRWAVRRPALLPPTMEGSDGGNCGFTATGSARACGWGALPPDISTAAGVVAVHHGNTSGGSVHVHAAGGANACRARGGAGGRYRSEAGEGVAPREETTRVLRVGGDSRSIGSASASASSLGCFAALALPLIAADALFGGMADHENQ